MFNADGARVVLVRGPAGFGKTTVLQQLHQRYLREGTPCAWINLDDADNDPPRFLTYFGLSLRSILDPAMSDMVPSLAALPFTEPLSGFGAKGVQGCRVSCRRADQVCAD